MKIVEFDEFRETVAKLSDDANAEFKESTGIDSQKAVNNLMSRVELLFILMEQFGFVFVENEGRKHIDGCACKLFMAAMIGITPYAIFNEIHDHSDSPELALIAAKNADREEQRILGASLIEAAMGHNHICIISVDKLEDEE